MAKKTKKKTNEKKIQTPTTTPKPRGVKHHDGADFFG